MTFSERNFRYDLEYRNAISRFKRRVAFKICEAYNGNKSGTATRVNASISILFVTILVRSFSVLLYVFYSHLIQSGSNFLLNAYLHVSICLPDWSSFQLSVLQPKTRVITLANYNRCKQHNEPIRIRSKYM